MKRKIFFNWIGVKESVLFLTFLLFSLVSNTNTKIIKASSETTLHEETIEIYWNQGIAVNTSMVYNNGEVFLGFSVESKSNSSVLFTHVPATGSGYSVNWTPTIEDEILLNPGESYSINHTLKISDRGVGMFIKYYCTVPTMNSNATIIFTTMVLNFGYKLSFFDFGLTLLTCTIIVIVYKSFKRRTENI
ncbi:MAG: hypothetical protein GPJ52_00100 [Candidatus Heimdallarchaeota archaeon]|nr:hypothetical protein [Candidatus Heimdallarchaeota archaeon]